LNRQRSKQSAPWLAKMRAEGEARATRKSQERVLARMAELELGGMYRVMACATALSEETGKSIAECMAWIAAQQKGVLDAKAKLEAGFAAAEAKH
jgi:hypothetical protein